LVWPEIAERDRVGLFRRFAIMRHWMSAAPVEAIARNRRGYQTERSPAAPPAWGPGATDSETSREP
jgi:hypothetical protein